MRSSSAIVWVLASVLLLSRYAQAGHLLKLADNSKPLPVEPADDRALQQLLGQVQETFVLYSALRDPVEGKVRVFFDAESFMAPALRWCHFVKSSWGSPVPTILSANESVVEGNLTRISSTARRFQGYMLSCTDPGPTWKLLVWKSHEDLSWGLPLQVVQVQTVSTQLRGVGWCAATVYSHRPQLEAWIQDVVKLGVQRIHLYYAQLREENTSLFYGVRHLQGPTLLDAFQPVEHARLRYYLASPPAERFYAAQTTLLTECVQRNRHAHSFIVIADTDEVLTMAKPSETLEAMLRAALPDTSASLLLATVQYPLACQNRTKSTIGIGEGSHFFLQDEDIWRSPKSIVAPVRVEFVWEHWVQVAEPGYDGRANLPVEQGYFKHIKMEASDCQHFRHRPLADDRDLAALVKQAQRDP